MLLLLIPDCIAVGSINVAIGFVVSFINTWTIGGLLQVYLKRMCCLSLLGPVFSLCISTRESLQGGSSNILYFIIYTLFTSSVFSERGI